ncbi:hypothetical protein M422DRAFT_774515 [Sphaerobolus stellatus SS14]|nr:hypothetical protein M422DRAFT_774515 [Sphaerobolus stellatus SS14]
MASNRPSFPSLYNPQLVLDPFHASPRAKYLENAHDIYVFMLYWTFILYLPLFLFTGVSACLMLLLEPLRRVSTSTKLSVAIRRSPKDAEAAQRRYVVYGIGVLMLYCLAGMFLSILSTTVVGFLIAGVYAAARFRVSTWIPFVWALTQSSITVTSMCSLVIDIL